MAIALVGSRTSDYVNSNGTTLTASLTAAQTGNFSLLFIACRPSGDQVPTVTVTDTSSNTWSLLSSYTAPATTSTGTTGGVISHIFYSTTASSGSSVTITMTFSATIAARTYQLLTFSGTNGATNATVDTVRYATIGDTTQALSSTRSVDSGDLIIANHVERGTSGTLSATSTTSNGTWVPTNTTFSRQSSGATGSSNVNNSIAYKITTGTGDQTVDVSWTSTIATANISLMQIVKILQAPAFQTITRTATGSGLGTEYAAIPANPSANDITDFVFAFAATPGFYLGPETFSTSANGSGIGSQTATGLRVIIRTASDSASGTQTGSAVIIPVRTATGSGSSDSSATRVIAVVRTATGSGTSSESVVALEVLPRTATGSGQATTASVAIGLLTVIRAATGNGTGDQTAAFIRGLVRIATGSGTGTSETIGARLATATATGSGTGTSSTTTFKNLVFRTPATTEIAAANYRDQSVPSRLFKHAQPTYAGVNVYKLVDGSYTQVEQRDYDLIEKVYWGGTLNVVTQEEKDDLIANGYGSYVS